jgi:hypothetical protein
MNTRPDPLTLIVQLPLTPTRLTVAELAVPRGLKVIMVLPVLKPTPPDSATANNVFPAHVALYVLFALSRLTVASLLVFTAAVLACIK